MNHSRSILILTALAASCATPLQKKVKSYGFEPFAVPTVTNRSGWAYDAKKQEPIGKKCFMGEASQGGSFDKDSVTYSGRTLASFGLDWKNFLNLTLGSDTTSTITVTLEGLEEDALTELAPTFSTACLTIDNVYVPNREVITHQLRAKKVFVSVVGSGSSSATLKVALDALAATGLSVPEQAGASAALESGKREVLVGKNLFLGFKTSRMNPTRTSARIELTRAEPRVEAGGYQVLLEDLHEDAGGKGFAKIQLRGTDVKFAPKRTDVELGDRVEGAQTAHRLDSFSVIGVTKEKLILDFRSIIYERR